MASDLSLIGSLTGGPSKHVTCSWLSRWSSAVASGGLGGVSVSADVPFNPEPTKEGILQRLRDRVDGDGSTDEEDVLRAAQDAADRIQRLRREVEPAKVASLASA